MNLSVMANTPENISIGLESVYKNVYEIKLSSEDDFKIGYFDEGDWEEEGTLESNTLYIKLSSETYYEYDEVYGSLEDAYNALEVYDDEAIVAYIEPEEYKIYTTDSDADERVVSNSRRIVISDESKDAVLVSENNKMPLGFQGAYDSYRFPATGVGESRCYRGVIQVVPGQGKGLTAVNVVDFEEYLYGVVPCEMSASWPIEALKAQAVAARSMAVYQYNRFLSRGYNLVDTTSSQVYRGITSEHPNTNKAVDDTCGELAMYNGKVAETVYFASSGGHTENVKYVWGNQVDYLSGVADPFESEEDHRYWTRTITLEELEKCVADDGVDIGKVKGMEIVSWTNSGRVKELHIIGSKDVYKLDREGVRTFFGPSKEGSLRSTMYKFEPYKAGGKKEKMNLMAKKNEIATKVALQSSGDLTEKELEGLIIIGREDANFVSDEPVFVMSANDLVELDVVTEDMSKPSEDDDHDTPNFETDEDFVPSDSTRVVYGDVTLYGKGYGHGVGMSQTGAKGMAAAGYDYEEIIEYYYPGVEVK